MSTLHSAGFGRLAVLISHHEGLARMHLSTVLSSALRWVGRTVNAMGVGVSYVSVSK